MLATIYEAAPGMTWARKDNLKQELGPKLYLAPKDSIDNYEQVEPTPEEEKDIKE